MKLLGISLQSLLLFLVLFVGISTARRSKRQIIFEDNDSNRLFNSDCRTPDRRPGRCIRLTSCRALAGVNRNRLRRFFCGFEGDEPSVCCPMTREEIEATVRPPTPRPVRTTTRPVRLTPRPVRTTSRPTVRPEEEPRNAIGGNARGGGGGSKPAFLPQVCGVTQSTLTRVVGGSRADIGSWPWMAVVFVRRSNGVLVPDCGGALVSNRHVVTAAHCVVTGRRSIPLDPSRVVVRLGAFNLTVRNEPGSVDVEVEDIRRHDQFEARTYRNDIAVLKLRTPVTFTDLISPVCLPYDRLNTVESVNSKNVIVTGYGTTAFNGNSSDVLMQAGFSVQSQEVCRRAYEPEVQISDVYMCAGTMDGSKDACQGDSGGPLVAFEGGSYYLVGIVSFGIQCGQPNYPGVYTRVSQFLDWILCSNCRDFSKMNLLLWQVTVVVCFAKLGLCIFLKSSPENIDALHTLKDKEYTVLCPSTNPRISIYLPHPEDCSQFYICENKIPYPKKCPKGLHFNNKLKICDYPEIAGCDKNAEEKVKDRIGKEKFETCPKKNLKFPVYLADPEDCTKFFICDNGVPHSKKCFPGLHFNPKINACDYPKNAKCDTNADDNAKGRITDNDEGECPKENSIVPVYLPHPDDCNKFYICDNGSPILKKCLPRLHFNPKLNACDFPQNAGCDKGKPKGKTSDNSLDICQAEDSATPKFFPHPDDCNKFYTCFEGSKFTQKCPGSLHFNPKLNYCDYPENAGCDTGESRILQGLPLDPAYFFSCPDADTPTLHSHPTDCDKFYECNHGKPILKSCEPGFNFNEETHVCDQAENTICEKETTLAFAGVRSQYCPLVDGKIPIFYRHPTNCSVYYMCAHGYAYKFTCPARLHFNLRRRLCDYEENAKCKT